MEDSVGSANPLRAASLTVEYSRAQQPCREGDNTASGSGAQSQGDK